MKIAIAGVVTKPIIPHPLGGTERMTYLLVEGLVKRGHEVILYCAKGSTTSAHQREICDASQAMGQESNIEFVYPYTLLEIRKIIEDTTTMQFDIIHVNILKSFMVSFFAPQISAPILYTLHRDFFSHPKIASVYQKIGIHDNEYFAFVSKNAAKRSLLKVRSSVIYNGIPSQEYPFATENNQQYFLWLSRMDPLKGPVDAIEAAKKAQVSLKMLGDIDRDFYEQYFVKEIQPFLSSQISYERGGSFEHKIDLYQEAKAFIFSSHWDEAFGLVVIEAMSCGTPVIAYKRGAMSELIEDGVTGYLVDPQKGVEGLAEAIQKINALSKEEYVQMRKASRKRVEEHFSIEKTVENYEMLYKKILQGM